MTPDERSELLLQIEDGDPEGWSVQIFEDEWEAFYADDDGPKWEIQWNGYTFTVVYEHGWYHQRGEANSKEQVIALSRAFSHVYLKFSEALDFYGFWT